MLDNNRRNQTSKIVLQLTNFARRSRRRILISRNASFSPTSAVFHYKTRWTSKTTGFGDLSVRKLSTSLRKAFQRSRYGASSPGLRQLAMFTTKILQETCTKGVYGNICFPRLSITLSTWFLTGRIFLALENSGQTIFEPKSSQIDWGGRGDQISGQLNLPSWRK